MRAFLSCERADRDIARVFVDGLHNAGHEIWFDEIELTSKIALGGDLDRALKACRAMIVLVSTSVLSRKVVWYNRRWLSSG